MRLQSVAMKQLEKCGYNHVMAANSTPKRRYRFKTNEESRAQAGNYQSSDEEHDRRRMMAAGSSSSAHASAATGTGNSHPHTVVINF